VEVEIKMMYKVPMPTKHNGIKIYTLPNQQLGIEYPDSVVPKVTMALDAAHGATRNVTFVARDAMPIAGQSPLKGKDMDPDTTDTDAALANVIEFLQDIISPNDLEIVQLLFGGADDVDAARETQAQGRRDDDRRSPSAADQARRHRFAVDAQRAQLQRRPMSSSVEQDYMKLFPQANRLV
jgi:hypothetical protein